MFKRLKSFICGTDKTIHVLESRITVLEDELLYIRNERNKLHTDLRELRDSKFHDFYSEHVSVDFSRIGAICIERTLNEQSKPITVIGYLMSEDSLQLSEWSLNITEERHMQLVEEFNLYKDSKCKDADDIEHI